MTQEEIKETWNEAARRLYRPTQDEFEVRYRRNKETALERLALKYKRFSRFALVMMVMCSLYLIPNQLFPSGLRIWVALGFALYLGTCSCMDYWLYKGVSSIDCYTMTVSEVVSKAMYYRRKHLQFIAILLPWIFCMIWMLIYATGFDRYFMYGILTGAFVGGAIGYRKYLEFMAEYKKIDS
ncbi:MAG: hypothetical protein K2G29_09940 [Muribaculaceae bacterium]|nr:hypothetical protein [Muribaculaceae bacterium]MDE6421788.1 hypothetical protein [Muribaculaceae bacterium]